jgi:hypothetical protein
MTTSTAPKAGAKIRKTETISVTPEERPTLEQLAAHFGNGSITEYVRSTYRVMMSVMIAEQLRAAQAYGSERSAELGITSHEQAVEATMAALRKKQ